jgi:energy-converting hydrogenase Eha subunit G
MTETVGTQFDVESQTAGTISNVGGDQNVYMDGIKRGVGVGRALWAAGLAAFFTGLALASVTAVQTTNTLRGNSDWSHWNQHVPQLWMLSVVLLSVGIVLTRFGRVFAGR